MGLDDKLLATRLKSIAHYHREIKEQEQTLATTRETLATLLREIGDYLPVRKGDILLMKDFRTIKVISFKNAYISADGTIGATLNVQEPGNYGSWSSSTISLAIDKFYELRVIDHDPSFDS